MKCKEEVINNIIRRLEDDLIKCNSTIRLNKYEFKKLAEKQALLKRERVILTDLINQLKNTKKDNI